MDTANSPAIELVDLTFAYSLDDGRKLEVISNLSLVIARGEFAVLVGPSGCGKTTLLRLISGLLAPNRGSVIIAGHQTRAAGDIGFVFQEPTLLPWLDVGDNVRLPCELLERSISIGRLEAELARVGLSAFVRVFPDELSGGMRSRVALARALITDPVILLLDEPFGSLDELTAETLCLELRRIWESSRITVLMVTHNLEHAAFLGTKVIVSTPRPLSIVGELNLDASHRDVDFMRSDSFVSRLIKLRSLFRDGLDRHRHSQ